MKLKLVLKDDRFLLCDELGQPLPCQRNIVVKQLIDDVTTVTVEFVIDSETLPIVGHS
jgi:hypothetical protein